MTGLLFLSAIVAVGLLIGWVIQNDAPGIEGGKTGIFAMEPDDDQTDPDVPFGAGRGQKKLPWQR